MDNWTTRYTHNGVSYVHDSYNGTTIPAAVYDAIHEVNRSNVRIVCKPIPKHPLRGKTVTVVSGALTITGKVMGYDDPEGTVIKIKCARGIAYVDASTVLS